MKFTLNSFSQAAEAGIMEEMNRYLVIIALLYALRKNKWQVPITIFISALFFGLLHFANFGWQKLAPTIAQVTFAFGIGLFFAIVYLYTIFQDTNSTAKWKSYQIRCIKISIKT